jgi:ribonuclease BN (tRNA processing enzyme)
MLFKIIKLISATIKILKQQRHYADNGKVIENAKLTFDPIAPKKYAFCSDTAYHEAILPIIKNVDVLYHETTFLQSEAWQKRHYIPHPKKQLQLH